MALSDQQKIDIIFKKLSYAVTKTGSVRGSGNIGGVLKDPNEEAVGSPLVVPNSSIWAESTNIPATAPASTTPYVQVYGPSNPLRMTKDSTITGNRTWFATTTPGTESSRVGDWIDPGNFGATYLAKIYYGPLVGGSVNPSNSLNSGGSGNNDSWYFDYAAGVLNFADTNLPSAIGSNDLYLVAYRYIGLKGASGGGGASITISDTAPLEPVAGAMWWNSSTGDLLIYYDDTSGSPSAQWVSAIGGVGGLWSLASSTVSTTYNTSITGNLSISGSLSKGSGSFKISHPLPELNQTHDLYHSFIEGPKADLIYRGEVKLVEGKASVNIDEVSKMTNGTFESLCRNISCFTTNETDWTPVRGKVNGNILTIESQDVTSTSVVSWLVIGERKDPDMFNLPWTDSQGQPSPEVLKQTDSIDQNDE